MSKKKKKKNTPKEEVNVEKKLKEDKVIEEKVKEKEETVKDKVIETNDEVKEENKKEKTVEKTAKNNAKVKHENYCEERMTIQEKEKEVPRDKKVFKHPLVHSFLVLVLLTSLAYFIISLFYTKTDSLSTLVNSLLLMLFTLLFVSVSITTNRKNKRGFFLSAFILFGYFAFGILMTLGIISFPNNKVIDFTGMSLTEVIEWSQEHKVEIVQDYEYSDMIEEYFIISQDVEVGTKIKNIDSITVAVSEGPNPSKEIVIPNMISWDSERVLEFIKENHLSNVVVEFVKSSKVVNTVIEQSKSGNIKRDEELKLVFSYGEELDYEEVKLKDLTGMSKFEATFYLKQHQLNYQFEEMFSSDVKNGYVVKQSAEAGDMVKVNGDTITIFISMGPEIIVPNLREMTMTEITDWVIKNKLKLEFTDQYDDSIKENSVIKSNYDQGAVVSEGTVIEVVISRGKLIMPEFENYSEFREWADKYGISYEEQHQFSNDINAGEVISYSYTTGETIRNNDSVIVIISDGKEAEVPNLVGSTKSQATTKLKNAGFNYNFVYSYSNTVAEGKVIKQSIGAGSKVARGTTVTVTISNGKRPTSNSGSSNSGGSSSGGSTSTTPTCDTSKGATFYVGVGNNGSQVLSSTKSQNPGFTVVANYVDSCSNGDSNSGAVCNSSSYDGKWISYCTTISLTIVK